jgi:hypothetical protein
MPEKRRYTPLPILSREQVEEAIKTNDIDVLIYAALSLATYDSSWKYVQDVCIRLSEHSHTTVRGNAVLALGYVARHHRKLEKHLVKPILLRAQKDHENEVCERAECALDDVNHFMQWRIGHKHREKKDNM